MPALLVIAAVVVIVSLADTYCWLLPVVIGFAILYGIALVGGRELTYALARRRVRRDAQKAISDEQRRAQRVEDALLDLFRETQARISKDDDQAL